MTLILFLTIVALGIGMAFKQLGFDVSINLPSSRNKLRTDAVPIEPTSSTYKSFSTNAADYIGSKIEETKSQVLKDKMDILNDRILRLEAMLAEKNRQFDKLSIQLDSEKTTRIEFERMRILMDEEITRLRAQNRIAKFQGEVNNV